MLLVLGLAGSLSRQQEADRQTGEALAQTKVALLGYATTYLERQGTGSDQFGYLPCPDTVVSAIPEGNEESTCGARDVTSLGRLPWKSLGVPPLRDSASECLWYAVSGNFKAGTKSHLLNWDSNALIEVLAPDGTIRLAGSTPTNRAAAVVFGPGAVLPGQDRTSLAGTPTCGGNYTASNYLDTDPASGISNATSSATANALSNTIAALNADQVADPNHNFNDRLIFITAEEIWREVGRRSDFIARLTDTDPDTGLLGFAAHCLAQQALANSRRFPWAAPAALPNYHPDANYASQTGTLAARLPYVLASCAGWPDMQSFWRNWKDHFFYVVAEPFKADSTFSTEPDPCLFGKCLTVDGEGPFAAVLIFAGERRDGQSRNTNADYSSPDKGNLANYLEDENLFALQASAPSDPNWGIFMRTAGNDIVLPICADAALNVYPNCDFATTPPQSQCESDGLLLLGYQDSVDPKKNNCKNTAGKGKHADPAIQECQDIRDRIKANCKKPCRDAAEDFLRRPCIDNLEDNKCVKVLEDLGTCEAK
ncbi:MAG TPA: hypothetical protein VMP00_04830 [Burkholderiales bacterium]|nr:hypothetical protein [Burkholderiales bacterium]